VLEIKSQAESELQSAIGTLKPEEPRCWRCCAAGWRKKRGNGMRKGASVIRQAIGARSGLIFDSHGQVIFENDVLHRSQTGKEGPQRSGTMFTHSRLTFLQGVRRG
jgi:hypothetical protein